MSDLFLRATIAANLHRNTATVVVIPKPAGIYALEGPDGVEVWHHDDTGYWQHVGTVRDGGFTDDELAAYLRVRGGRLDLLVKHRDADQ